MIFGRRIHEPVVVVTCSTEAEAEAVWTRLIDADIPSVVQHDPAMLGGAKSFQVLVESGRRADAIVALSKGTTVEPSED